MTRLFSFIIIIFVYGKAFTQSISPSIFSPSGGSTITSGIWLDWTIGEPIVSTLTNDVIYLTQGFNQPSYAPVSGLVDQDINLTLSVFPNPVTDIINLRFEEKNSTYFTFKLYNALGIPCLHYENGANHFVQQFNVSSLPSGIYTLVVERPGHSTFKSIHIQKI